MDTTSRVDMLASEGLTMRFVAPEGKITLFENLHVSIARGHAVAILGASGSGKSTLLGLLAGLEQPCAGRVWFDGVDLTALDEDERARLRAGRVGFVFQSFHLLPGLTALENVMLPRELTGEPQARAQARAALAAVGLSGRLHFYPAQLSGGEQQRVALARAFVTPPALLFADEPTGNLDQHTAERVSRLLFGLNEAHGTTLVLATHDAMLAERCHVVLRLQEGRLEALR